MKLGILSDIHEAVELLEVAIRLLDGERVDRFVVLGDVFETGARIEETTALLAGLYSVGVYGNHDYGLSADPGEYHRSRFSTAVLEYMATLRPRIELDGCLIAHREPYLDGSRMTQIWDVEEEYLTPELLTRSFEAVPNRAIFVGHFHRWFAATRSGRIDWDGSTPLVLDREDPTLVVVNGVCEGFAAIFDTETGVLRPIDLYEGSDRPADTPLPRLITETFP